MRKCCLWYSSLTKRATFCSSEWWLLFSIGDCHSQSLFVTIGSFCLSGEAIPMHVRGLYAHLQHGGKPAHASEDAPRWIHVCVQPAGLRQGLPHILQPEDPRPRPHKREALWVWRARLWESLQHSLQVNMRTKHCFIRFTFASLSSCSCPPVGFAVKTAIALY